MTAQVGASPGAAAGDVMPDGGWRGMLVFDQRDLAHLCELSQVEATPGNIGVARACLESWDPTDAAWEDVLCDVADQCGIVEENGLEGLDWTGAGVEAPAPPPLGELPDVPDGCVGIPLGLEDLVGICALQGLPGTPGNLAWAGYHVRCGLEDMEVTDGRYPAAWEDLLESVRLASGFTQRMADAGDRDRKAGMEATDGERTANAETTYGYSASFGGTVTVESDHPLSKLEVLQLAWDNLAQDEGVEYTGFDEVWDWQRQDLMEEDSYDVEEARYAPGEAPEEGSQGSPGEDAR